MTVAKWRFFSKEQIEEIVKNSYSFREVALKLGYSQDGGGSIKSLQKMCQELQLDTSHFKGKGWNKDNYDYSSFTVDRPKKKGSAISKPLELIRGHKCENCGITEWLGKPIVLEVHHINGDRNDNRLENLQLLCPNCHSQTENWRKHKKRKDAKEQ